MAVAMRKPKSDDTEFLTPYSIGFEVKGVKDFLFNASSVEAFDAPPGRLARIEIEKDLERKVWRDQKGDLAVDSRQFIKAIKMASRGTKDFLSARAMLHSHIETYMTTRDNVCAFYETRDGERVPLVGWDYGHEAVVKNGNGSMGPRRRPALNAGWQTEVWLVVSLPEAVTPIVATQLMHRAGLFGVGDGIRLGYGKFVVTRVHEPQDVTWL